MKLQVYNYIYDKITCRDDVVDLVTQYPSLCFNTLFSIYSQKYQNTMRKTLHKHRQANNMAMYRQWYINGNSIVDIAEKVNIAPCLMARIIIQMHVSHLSPGIIESNLKSTTSSYLRDPGLIEDERLSREVAECVQVDDAYSPLVESIKREVGLEYEFRLCMKCTNKRWQFETEEVLRNLGYPKTPDVSFKQPIKVAIKVSDINREDSPAKTDDSIQNVQKLLKEAATTTYTAYWIESKASFCDDYARNLNKDQLLGYVSRFGPGIVIYWFGFIEELNDSVPYGVLMMDHFPDDAIQLHSGDDARRLEDSPET